MTLRVLHFIHSLSGGGAENQLCHLLSAHSPTVEHWVACVKDSPQAMPVDPRRVIALGVSAKNPRIYTAAMSAVRRLNPDIVHAWLPASVSIPAMLAGFLARKRVIFSFRNQMAFHRTMSYPEYAVAALCARSVVSNSASNHTHHPGFRWLFQRKEGQIIHNCVATGYAGRWRPAPELQSDRPLRILFAGRIVQQKNLATLLQALALLASAESFHLTVAGEGDLQDAMRQLVTDLGLNEKVSFIGFCDGLRDLMLASDLLVFPSFYEGMPNVLVEAMELGLPCIFSDIPAHRALVSGYDERAWFGPADKVALATILRAVLEDRTLLMQLSNSGADIAARFGVDAMVDRYDRYYRELRQK